MDEKILKVMLWGDEVGRLKWDHTKMRGVFTYNPEFIKKGLDIAPLTASINSGYGKGENVVGITFRKQNKFTGLPAFIADSLPDSWGKKLTLLWEKEFGMEGRRLSSIDYLAYMGKRAMGALEFEPDGCPWRQDISVDLGRMARLAEKIFHQRDSVTLLPEEEWDMAALCSVGTSAGGMQPKAILARNNDTGEIRSGQIMHDGNWNYYILKFSRADYEQQCELEMGYHLMAKSAGIDMMPCSLMEVDGKKHFLTQRYDRMDGEKIHVQTLGAMSPAAESYEDIMEICDELALPYKEKEQMFRRMVFNVYAGCTDDHNRNFSFLMNKDGKWHITPAYDLTFTVSVENGYIQGDEHELSIRGKYMDITDDDLLCFAKENDIKNTATIMSDVKKAISKVATFLKQAGVDNKRAEGIDLYLNGQQHISESLVNLNERLSEIVIYDDCKSIRCKINDVQQMGKTLSLPEQRKIKQLLKDGNSQELNEMKVILAGKYYKQTLNETEESMKRNNCFKI